MLCAKNIKLSCYITKLHSEMETKNPEKLIEKTLSCEETYTKTLEIILSRSPSMLKLQQRYNNLTPSLVQRFSGLTTILNKILRLFPSIFV